MRTFSIYLTEQRLSLKRNRSKDMLYSLSLSVGLAGFISVFFGLLPKHLNLPLLDRIAIFPVSAIFLVYLGRSFFILFQQEFVFDRALGQVVVNGHFVHPMAELQSVCLEHLFRNRSNTFRLSLQTKSHVKMEIVSDNSFGASETEMRSLGRTIATYAAIDLITPEEFIPASSGTVASQSLPKRWRGKGFRKPISRQRRHGVAERGATSDGSCS